jgi:hypothetical protein
MHPERQKKRPTTIVLTVFVIHGRCFLLKSASGAGNRPDVELFTE